MSAALGVLLLEGAPAAVAAPEAGINGSWVSVDLDGSNQTLSIHGSGDHRSMTLYDDLASNACDGDPARGQGSGTLDGDVLFVRATITCQPGGSLVHGHVELAFAYDSETDTIVDFSGVVWERA